MNGLLLILAILIIVLMVSAIKSKIGAFISWKRSVLIAVIYLAALMLLVPIFYLLPSKDLIKLNEKSNQTESVSRAFRAGRPTNDPGFQHIFTVCDGDGYFC